MKRCPSRVKSPTRSKPRTRRAIVHRDLKPANIKVRPDGTVNAVARIEIDEAQTRPDAEVTRAAAARGLHRVIAWTVAAVATAAAIALGVLYLRSTPATDAHPTRFAVAAPQSVTLNVDRGRFAEVKR